jgi:hypothetical protein
MAKQTFRDKVVDVASDRVRIENEADAIRELLRAGDVENLHKTPAERVGEVIGNEVRRRLINATMKMIDRFFSRRKKPIV